MFAKNMRIEDRRMVNIFKYVKFKNSFWVVVVFMTIIGCWKAYMIAIAFTFLHEICHIITANFFGIKTGKIFITPIGCIGVVKNFYNICCVKRCLVLLAGPLFNLLIFIIAFFAKLEYIMYVNLVLFLCNSIPVLPFDGGRIFKNILGEKIGILKMEKISGMLSGIFSIFIMILGMFQLIFFNFNISIFCLGVYIMKESKKESIMGIYSFYRAIIENRDKESIKKTKNVIASGDVFLWEFVRIMSTDSVLIVQICEKGIVKEVLTQWQIIDRIEREGIFEKTIAK